jgi:excinuclease ABC subunit C
MRKCKNFDWKTCQNPSLYDKILELIKAPQFFDAAGKMAKVKQLDLFDRTTPKQLWLLNFANPLIDRLGKEFFSTVPKEPGVYRMKNERGEIIYVGKANSLRARLRSYTYANQENSSRKVLRLIYMVRSIEVETLPDEKSALIRENELLRTLKPYFNVMNTSPETYLFAHLKLDDEGLTIHLAMKEDHGYSDIYGAFKGLGLGYRAHKALLRLLWRSFNECRNGFELPSLLTNHRKLQHYSFQLPEELGADERLKLYRNLKKYFNGTSKCFLDDLVERLLERDDLATFVSESIQSDLEEVLEFYERSARRNRRIKKELDLGEGVLPQDKIDDFLVMLEKRE